MSVFDQAKEAFQNNGGQNAGGSQKYQALAAIIQQHGGLQGIIDTFHRGGLRGTVSSWVSTGQNLPISADQIQKVLGSEAVRKFAGQLGVDPAQAAQQIAKLLPQVVNRLTPGGQVPPEESIQTAMKDLIARGENHAA